METFEKKLTDLQLPKVSESALSINPDVSQRFPISSKQSPYYKFVNTEYGKNLITILEENKRVKSLIGKLIATGSSSAATFNTRNLGMWFIWYENKHGRKDAIVKLNKFLNEEKICVISALWVQGIEVKETINLSNGYKIQPIKTMPFSNETEAYNSQTTEDAFNIRQHPKPKCAITCTHAISKIAPHDIMPKDTAQILTTLKNIALTLNLLSGVSCLPYYSSSYLPEEVPTAWFSVSSGGSWREYDIIGTNCDFLPQDVDTLIKPFLEKFEAL